MFDMTCTNPSRTGFWLCLLLYVSAFALPMEFYERGYLPGVSMFWWGGIGFALSVFGLIGGLFHGFTWDGVTFGLATVPWLANLFLWFGLALYAQGHGRASFRTALVALVLASGVLVFNPLSLSYSIISRESVLRLFASPAYVAWAGSMALLAIFAAHLAWRQNRVAALWRPTPEWLAGIEGSAIDGLVLTSGRSASDAIVEDKPIDTARHPI